MLSAFTSYNTFFLSSSDDFGDKYPNGISNTVRAPTWPSLAILPIALAYATKTLAVNSGLLSRLRLNSILCFVPFPVVPERITIQHDNDMMLYMPCLTREGIGTKVLAQFPDNPAKGKPLIDGVMLLNNREDGSPKAIMNGRVLTGIRTGAVGGHAIKHLSHQQQHF